MIQAQVKTGTGKDVFLRNGKWLGNVPKSLALAINREVDRVIPPTDPDPIGNAAKLVAQLTGGRVVKSTRPKYNPRVDY